MNAIRFGENDRDGAVLELDAETASALRRTGLVQMTAIGPRHWLLQPCGKVGAAHAGGRDVIVEPKIGVARLLFLLGYATNPGFRPEDVTGVADSDLLPTLAESLCRHGERALASGVLQGYQTRDEALTVLRGRLRIGDQLARHPGTLLPLEVTHDEYSTDIPENRILRAAIRRALAIPRLPQRTRTRLGHLDGRLEGVQPLIPGAPLPRWQATRLNHHYQRALRLAQLVLGNQSLEVGPGGLRVAAFVVDMARVFEDFVTTAFKEALKHHPGRTHSQFNRTLDNEGLVTIRPDIVHTVDQIPHIIIDAKYKRQAADNNTDLYQMLAYCTALNVPTGWLIYAQGTPTPEAARIRNIKITVTSHSLDLTATPTTLLTQITHLTKTLWTERTTHPGL